MKAEPGQGRHTSPCHWFRFEQIMLLALMGGLSAFAAEPTTEPLLRLETGMHIATIRRVATDAQGRFAVTASDDKTARVWELESGRQLLVLRPPQDAGDEGKLYAVEMSPDGSTVAVVGRTGVGSGRSNSIYLFDRASGRLTRRITGLPDVVIHLAFSPDGRRLAASLMSDGGILMFETASGWEIGRDVEYGGDSYSVHFRPDGRQLVTTCYDGYVRLYAVEDEGLKLLKRTKTQGGQEPYSARFSPDGKGIAVGFGDTTTVQVLSGSTLEEMARPSTEGVDNGNLGRVAWSSDGRYLFAGGRWLVEGRHPVRRWPVGDWKHYKDVPVAENTIMELALLPDGRIVFAASDPAWGILGSDGAVERSVGGKIADFRAQRDQLRVSADGRRVRFGYRFGGEEPCVFDLATGNLGPDDSGLPAARTEAPGIRIEKWQGTYEPTLNGKPLKLERGEMSRSMAVAPNGQRFALGAEWHLRLFDRDGTEVWDKPVPEVVFAVTISGDGQPAEPFGHKSIAPLVAHSCADPKLPAQRAKILRLHGSTRKFSSLFH